jgi:hypothetical protein
MSILKICSDALCSMDKQHITALVAVDLSAAFDTVHHGVLLDVLTKFYDIDKTAKKWMASYLEGRTTEVQINDTLSDKKLLPYSVPQSSCAGPMLYNIYASTLEDHIHVSMYRVHLMGYADDHTAYDSFPATSREQEKACIQNLQKCLEEVRSWMSQNRLKMNDSKTETILFGNKPQLQKCMSTSIRVGNEEINLQDGSNI